MIKHLYISLGIALAAAIFTLFVYKQLPAMVPSHWNAVGEIDRYLSKGWHVGFFIPFIVFIPSLMTWLPKLDPKYKNMQTFEEDFGWFTVVLTAFLASMYVYATLSALGYKFPIQFFMIPALSVLFFTIGHMLAHTKSNYTIGIRVPWTLHSEKNWDLTHKLASQSFRYGSLVLLSTLLIPTYSFVIFIVFLFVMVLVPVIYSYWLHRKGV